MGLDSSSKTEVYGRDSVEKAFLGDDSLFYIAFVSAGQRLLLVGSFNQFGKNSALVSIPYFRERFQNFLDREKIEQKSGLGRTTRMLFNYIPTEILFLLPEESYIRIHSAIIEHDLKSSLRSVGILLSHDLSLLISFVPESGWSDQKWEESDQVLEKDWENFADYHITKYTVLRGKFLEGFHLIKGKGISEQKIFELSSRLEFHFRTWEDQLEIFWEDYAHNSIHTEGIRFYPDYKATHSPEQASLDLRTLAEIADPKDFIHVNIQERPDTTILYALTPKMKYYLSDWVSVLRDLGLKPISQRVYHFMFRGQSFAKSEFFFHRIENTRKLYSRLTSIFRSSMTGQIKTDSLSEIVLWTDLDADGVLFAKAIRDYCLQTNPVFNPEEVNRFLVDHPKLVESAWKLFFTRFQEGSEGQEESLELKRESDQGKTIREDSVLQSFASVVLGILRTDFFGSSFDSRVGKERDYISFKIDSSIPTSLPNPRPYREIFVYSDSFQGIHLRGGAVARGGIRYSDRVSDYRTELLGLLKTQMVKNSIIVPVGSKGSFVLTPNPFRANALPMEQAYSFFINGLLGVTDLEPSEPSKRIGAPQGNKISPLSEFPGSADSSQSSGSRPVNFPKKRDGWDPYLVVAADKGTASLSDLANSISLERNFWLGDAFASGGSNGYSHKKYGITAKGALVTADRSFRLLGIDFRSQSVSVVGIGDMGGDVFGNGLLESDCFLLVACFNHKHIFLDPNPDPKISYQERRRLFESTESGWDSYNPRLISKGGGIWNRTEKSIPISDEAKQRLGIREDFLSGNELVRAILSAPVDLLYNGGIGTYVKSSEEENSEVGDPANNDLRIDASALRCRVVSEGGNLGFTQAARIEYDRKGGMIYTDAIDNSAGVDLSDHEVNLKIFLGRLLVSNHLKNLEERNQILRSIDKDVVTLVLLDNEYQSLAIQVDYYRSKLLDWKPWIRAGQTFSQLGLLEPRLVGIPETEEGYQEWKIQYPDLGIPRPVISMLLGFFKMDLYKLCLESGEFLQSRYPDFYLTYFPESIQKKYRADLLEHPLGQEITATMAVNFLVNLMGLELFVLIPSDRKEIPRTVRVILEYCLEKGLPDLLEKFARIKDPKLEPAILDFFSALRTKLRSDFETSSRPDTQTWEKFMPFLDSRSRTNLEKIWT